MKNDKIISSKDAAKLVKDGDTLAITGFVSFGLAESILTELEQRFIDEKSPKDLFLFHVAGIAGDGIKRGINHFSHDKMIRKLYCSNCSLAPKIAKYIAENHFATYMKPQGVLSHLTRAIAGGKPGVITHVGLKTFCDPRVEACHANEKCNEIDEEVVELIHIGNKEHLFLS